jgi:hypothetical protein
VDSFWGLRSLERARQAAVLLDDLVDLLHQSDGLFLMAPIMFQVARAEKFCR